MFYPSLGSMMTTMKTKMMMLMITSTVILFATTTLGFVQPPPSSIIRPNHLHVDTITTTTRTTTTKTVSSLYVFGSNKSTKKRGNNNITPTLDKVTQKWVKGPDDDGKYPYDAFGALLRHGPGPFILRLTDPSGYEQSVLQYMATTKCTRSEATGNMDAKANNAADWAYQKMEEKKNPSKKKVDYTVLKTKDAILTILWALGITPLVVSSIIQVINEGGTGPSVIKY